MTSNRTANEQAKALKTTAKNIRTKLIPKLSLLKDNFTPSEWHIIELAMNNYVIDISNEAARLTVIVAQSGELSHKQ
ncbi:hypothetical protein LX87_05721 [Larkinella arboricola]|uniref:Uncharacterized protein n=1 Tax=Larkinella arboricola TaxID=643671 RepID=A0A327WFC4_LARAB|nr:hypothetical protein [Larkinella arboricola]RAJ89100.1 hypothetical protein LX87_05721 [Larkinella arboricola]